MPRAVRRGLKMRIARHCETFQTAASGALTTVFTFSARRRLAHLIGCSPLWGWRSVASTGGGGPRTLNYYNLTGIVTTVARLTENRERTRSQALEQLARRRFALLAEWLLRVRSNPNTRLGGNHSDQGEVTYGAVLCCGRAPRVLVRLIQQECPG